MVVVVVVVGGGGVVAVVVAAGVVFVDCSFRDVFVSSGAIIAATTNNFTFEKANN